MALSVLPQTSRSYPLPILYRVCLYVSVLEQNTTLTYPTQRIFLVANKYMKKCALYEKARSSRPSLTTFRENLQTWRMTSGNENISVMSQ